MVVRTPSRSAPAGARRAFRLALALSAALPIAGCSMFSDKKDDVAPDEPADKLYNEGLSGLDGGDYAAANKKFAEVDRQHPYTDWGRKSILMTTYASYRSGKYEDAISSGNRYVQQHPTSPDAAYAQYLVAMSYYNQVPDVSRDQERTRKSVDAFEELIRRWPTSEYADTARRRVAVARDQLAGKEMQVGRFYLQRRDYTGAINRFRVVVSQYQKTRHVEEALHRLVEAYMALGIVDEAQTAAAILGHNYPDSEWYKASYALMTSNGLKPQENTGSWISRAFHGVIG
ncbi:outer membrane protein assembly factor BamD [Hansschlegelia plantiphila]|uniref:Outer membrane protein assembly factor BamD n=1 Tax=Hansschlegelia plantiphila TaxID=374655 RepID=A0A9W6IXA4_9HYPH|nr:outer membrane protein assembly factor BamD [Hansschlegelia plantiphila]GLK66855.1 outer membrane protein assembly factor BamD [Hansschlegelia plantiphila]